MRVARNFLAPARLFNLVALASCDTALARWTDRKLEGYGGVQSGRPALEILVHNLFTLFPINMDQSGQIRTDGD
jgi:hypothetical protein